jgi:hypothetical protein
VVLLVVFALTVVMVDELHALALVLEERIGELPPAALLAAESPRSAVTPALDDEPLLVAVGRSWPFITPLRLGSLASGCSHLA